MDKIERQSFAVNTILKRIEAFERAEDLPRLKIAYLELSILEQEIAAKYPPYHAEGAAARPGAVLAAIKGGDVQQAKRLYVQYSNDDMVGKGEKENMRAMIAACEKAQSLAAVE
jgi:hypothetical protein